MSGRQRGSEKKHASTVRRKSTHANRCDGEKAETGLTLQGLSGTLILLPVTSGADLSEGLLL